MKTNKYFLVFIGGGLGALLRDVISIFLEIAFTPAISSSLSLFVVNILGALALGLTSVFESEQKRIFWGAGFAGGFTTMSGVSIFLYTQTPMIAVPATAVMFGLGFIAYAAGSNLARVWKAAK
jgi:fluoride ion exporter CrcB/FEX